MVQIKFFVFVCVDVCIFIFFFDVNYEFDYYWMLIEVFFECFGGMIMVEYGDVVFGGFDCEFFVGLIVEYQVVGEIWVYGFMIWDDLELSQGLICLQLVVVEVELVVYFELWLLVFVLLGVVQLLMVNECGVVIYDLGVGVLYEVYSVVEGFGYVCGYDVLGFVQVQVQLQLSWCDILVLLEVLFDISQVVFGVVLGMW